MKVQDLLYIRKYKYTYFGKGSNFYNNQVSKYYTTGTNFHKKIEMGLRVSRNPINPINSGSEN